MLKIDFSALVGTVKDVILDGLSDVISGAKEDLQVFGLAIAEDFVRVASEGGPDRQEKLDLLVAQSRGLAEAQRIRVNAAGWAAATKTLKAVGGILIGTIGGLL